MWPSAPTPSCRLKSRWWCPMPLRIRALPITRLLRKSPTSASMLAFPLVTPEGQALGTLCVVDYQPRHLTPEQLEQLQALAHQVVAQLELRRTLRELARTPLLSKPGDTSNLPVKTAFSSKLPPVLA
jgi:GAF domain-containing protein